MDLCHLKKRRIGRTLAKTEADIISLDTGLRVEALPALTMWDIVMDVLESLVSRARGDPLRQLQTRKPQTMRESNDIATPNMPYVYHISQHWIFLIREASSFSGSPDLTVHPHVV